MHPLIIDGPPGLLEDEILARKSTERMRSKYTLMNRFCFWIPSWPNLAARPTNEKPTTLARRDIWYLVVVDGPDQASTHIRTGFENGKQTAEHESLMITSGCRGADSMMG